MKRELTIYDRNRGYNNHIPELRLMGAWLKELGFNQGDKITVELIEGKLVIQKLPLIEEIKPSKN